MNYTIYSANEWMYPDEVQSTFQNNRFRISSARGSYATCQLVVGSELKGSSIRWHFQPDPDIHVKPMNGDIVPKLFQLYDVAVEVNTGYESYTVIDGEEAGSYISRIAPFRVYDAMKPMFGDCECLADQMAFYVSFHIGNHVEPRIYTWRLSMQAGQEHCEVTIDIEVYPVEVPAQETLSISNWFNLDHMADRHGFARWSEAHWAMIAKYAKLMRHVRQTHFLVPIELVAYTFSAEGKISFEFDKVKRFIELFLELGFTFIEGGPPAVQLQLGDPHFMLKTDRSIHACSIEGYTFIAQYLQAWYSFLQENQWLERTVQHAADEPFDSSIDDFKSIVCMVRKFMPGIKIIEAVCTYKVDGTADIIIPTNQYYEEHNEQFERLRNLGDKIWFYTCSIPGGHYMNRLMDIPLLKTRLMHWGNYLYQLEGYLHWGFNCYRAGQNPFEDNCPVHMSTKERKRTPAGNTHIVYPGDDGPWGSVRLEAMRSGIEDYELLNMLGNRDQAEANNILHTCMRSFTDSCNHAVEFDDIHRRLLEALS